MANLYTRKQLAALIDRSPQQVGGEIRRGNIIEEKKRIDTSHPINIAFIAKWTGKNLNEQVQEDEPTKKEISKSEVVDFFEALAGINPGNVEYLKKKHEIKKLQTEIRLKDLEYKKKKAKVLPLDFVIDWSGRNIRGVFGETVNFGNSIIEDICNELEADTATKLKFKKMFKQGFNEMVKNGIKNQEPEALEFAKEYSLTTKW